MAAVIALASFPGLLLRTLEDEDEDKDAEEEEAEEDRDFLPLPPVPPPPPTSSARSFAVEGIALARAAIARD